MITREFAEKYRDCYEAGMTIEEYVDFFKSCQSFAEEIGDVDFAKLNDAELAELAQAVIEINEH